MPCEKNIKITHIPAALCTLTLLATACTPLTFSTDPCHKPIQPTIDRVKVAFVLGGGGAKGMAHVGVMEELLKAGIQPDLIVGCSAGAIVGGLYADQPDIKRLKNLLMEKRREHLLNISISYLPFGFSNGHALKDFLNTNLKAKTFCELRIPFVAVATNLQYGDLVPFWSGPLEPAIRASSSYPGVFIPTLISGQYFVDGGVTDNVPTEVARRMGAEYVIAIELDTDLPDAPPNNAMGIVKRSLEISLKHQSIHSSRYANYTIKVPLTGIGTFEDEVNEIVYEKGRKAAQEALPKIMKHLPRE